MQLSENCCKHLLPQAEHLFSTKLCLILLQCSVSKKVQGKTDGKHRQRYSGPHGNQSCFATSSLPLATLLIVLKEPAAHRVANYIPFLPWYKLHEYADSSEEREMLVCYIDSAFFCVFSLSCSLQVFFFFFFLPVLDEMLSNEALCWEDDTYTPEIFILNCPQAPYECNSE